MSASCGLSWGCISGRVEGKIRFLKGIPGTQEPLQSRNKTRMLAVTMALLY